MGYDELCQCDYHATFFPYKIIFHWLRAMLPRHFLSLYVCFVLQGVVRTKSSFSASYPVVNITKDVLDDITVQNKSAFILFYSER